MLSPMIAAAAAAVPAPDHQAQGGHGRTGRVRVARDREPADDPLRRLRDEDGGMRRAADRAEIAPFGGRPTPVAGGDQPALGLCADGARERDELCGVTRCSPPDRELVHSTTTPSPPRRGSPAAARAPSARNSTADAPPKKRFRLRQRTRSYPRSSSRSSSAG